jgi:hypothetical protein
MSSYISPEYTQRQEVNYQSKQDGSLIISTNKCTKTSLSLFPLLKECPNTHFGNYIAIIRGIF